MKAVVLTAPGEYAVEEVADPTPGADQVVISVLASGICGTDLHTLAGENPQVVLPVIPGHEFVGRVEMVGAGVKNLQVGDAVAVDPSRSCGRCRHCRELRPNLCQNKGGHGSKLPGGFAERVVVKADACVPLDPNMKIERAVLAEPLACVLHGMDRLGPVLGKTALVYGAGAIGMLTAALLSRAGAQVQMLERSEERREIARSWGIPCADLPEDYTETAWDVVVDATGAPQAIADALVRVRRGGTCLLMGVAPAGRTIPFEPHRVNWHELTIIGSMAIQGSFQRAVDLLPQIDYPLETLVTHRLPLSEFAQAIDLVQSRHALKVILSGTDS